MKIVTRSYLYFLSILPSILTLFLSSDTTHWILSIFLTCILFVVSTKVVSALFFPLENLKSGVETLRDGDYTVFLNKKGSHEANVLIDVYNEMIEQLRSGRLQAKQIQQFFEAIIQKMPVAVVIVSTENSLTYLNQYAEQYFKLALSDYRHRKISIIENSFLQQIVSDSKKGLSWQSFEGRTFKIRRDRLVVKSETSDVFMIEELTTQLNNYQTVAWRKIVRVISHEIQNSISPILSINQSLDLAIRKENLDPDYLDGLSAVNRRLTHLSSFITDYGRFAKTAEPKSENVPVDVFFGDILRLFKKEGVSISFSNTAKIQYLFFDLRLMEQVMINLIKNAIEACDKKATAHVSIDLIKRNKHPTICVKDNGQGISAEGKENLFVPYYTTKSSGSGIGLSLVQDILNQHGFYYFVESELGVGTTFFIEMT